ncbi:MAG TPA: ATP-binding protein [Casimicrobiaceae bacterium]|nr:ATP-binding protein [Casimicrobiaceae bacterium]
MNDKRASNNRKRFAAMVLGHGGGHEDRVHPIVRLDRVVRVISCPLGAGFIASLRIDLPTPLWLWGALAAYALAWPHLAYLFGRYSRDPKRTEHLCLLVDCAFFGASGMLVGYLLVPTIVLTTSILTAVASVGGFPLFFAGLAVLGAVYLAGSFTADWQTMAQTPTIAIVLSLTLAFLFQLLLAIQTYRQARALNQMRRQVEEQTMQIIEQNEALEAAIQSAEEARQSMEAANLAKSRFLANMSHELRTPLNAIIGYTELILDSTYGEINEKVRGTLSRVERSGRLLLGLINEVLDLSKIEAGQLKLDVASFRLNDTINTVVNALEGLAREKSLNLHAQVAPDLPPVIGDERRITQVLMNLVGNAVKFTDSGEVEIAAKIDAQSFLITVRDTGPGVPLEFRDQIFKEFQQADSSTTRSKGGTGLGLAIAKRIVEMHGGDLRLVQSEPGHGSTFGFTLPRERTAEAGSTLLPTSEATPS